MIASIIVSSDGQWVAVRRGREVALLANGTGAPVGMLELDRDDVDLAMIGPPDMLVVVSRTAADTDATRDPAPRVTLHQPPYLDAVARLDLEVPMRLAATTGPRFALTSADGERVLMVRVAGRAMSSQLLDKEGAAEFVVGLERNQFLLGLLRKFEVWDAVSGRPTHRLQLHLPPLPRVVGSAQGHLWVTRPGTDEIYLFRLSDGRPFPHLAGSPIDAVIGHHTSPVLVLVTRAGLLRLQCFAHSLIPLDVAWTPGTPLAQLVTGDDVALLGLASGSAAPWRAPIAGAGAPAFFVDATAADVDPLLAAPPSPLAPLPAIEPPPHARAPDVAPVGVPAALPAPTPFVVTPPALTPPALTPPALTPPALTPPVAIPPLPASQPSPPLPAVLTLGREAPAIATLHAPLTVALDSPRPDPAWRAALGAFGADLVRGSDNPDLPALPADNELDQLAHRLDLSATARRALTALYALYLAGEPPISIVRLAKLTADWTEPLGQGELAALALLRRRDGRISLRRPVTDLLDGAAPREITFAGIGSPRPVAGAHRVARNGKSDLELESELASYLGRIALLEGDPDRGLLEARLHDVAAVTFQTLARKPRPWPRDAALVLVLYGSPTSWVADLPSLELSAPPSA